MKIKINVFKILKYHYIILFIIAIIALFVFSLFLYNNCYKTLTKIEKIVILREEVALVDLEKNTLEQAINSLEMKKKNPEVNWNQFRNSFLPYVLDE